MDSILIIFWTLILLCLGVIFPTFGTVLMAVVLFSWLSDLRCKNSNE